MYACIPKCIFVLGVTIFNSFLDKDSHHSPCGWELEWENWCLFEKKEIRKSNSKNSELAVFSMKIERKKNLTKTFSYFRVLTNEILHQHLVGPVFWVLNFRFHDVTFFQVLKPCELPMCSTISLTKEVSILNPYLIQLWERFVLVIEDHSQEFYLVNFFTAVVKATHWLFWVNKKNLHTYTSFRFYHFHVK